MHYLLKKELSTKWEKKTQLYNYIIFKDTQKILTLGLFYLTCHKPNDGKLGFETSRKLGCC